MRGFLQRLAVCAVVGMSCLSAAGGEKTFLAGAAEVDISPKKLPAIVSGGFLQKTGDKIHDPLFARCLVLDDGSTRLALVVVENLMMPRELLDEAKRIAHQTTGIPVDRIMVSAVHTHSAPAVMGALGTGIDEDYAARLPGWIAESIAAAARKLAPAKVGWTVVADEGHTHCRRWIRRPDKMVMDPFGDRTVRAMMHPGYQNPEFEGPAGPVDPNLTLLAVQTQAGQPIAILANYSMHYFGAAPISADYFGLFSRNVAESAGAGCVVMMSQGTAGDLHWMDYSQPKKNLTIATYSDEVARIATDAYRKIEYRDWVSVAMAEDKLTLGRRLPDEKRLAWAKERIAAMKDRTVPANQQEVYAKEQIYLVEQPQRELVLQAIRIGDLGITAIPNEVFGITGLKLKAQSPLTPTLNIELANGGEGYIPPPEQHKLGGYTTWPARTASLEPEAEPKIIERVLRLLEKVAGKPRRPVAEPQGKLARAVWGASPAAYWRLDEMAGPIAHDASPNAQHGRYEDGIAFYLDGPASAAFSGDGKVNRCAHFAGGRMVADVKGLGEKYSVELWFWNALPNDARPITGCLFGRADAAAKSAEWLAIRGGRLAFSTGSGDEETLTGEPEIGLRQWHHVVLNRDRAFAAVYLDGKPIFEGRAKKTLSPGASRLYIGGKHDRESTFEGKIDEVAVFARAISADEIARRFSSATQKQNKEPPK